MASIYNAADYPAGVPSPFVRNVQEYPSQQHGGDWTRPVFTFPWKDNPHMVVGPPGNVYRGSLWGLGNYGRDVLLGSPENRRRFTGGMAAPDVATRGGIFGPQGYGGGIFDGSLGETESGTRSADVPWGEYDKDTEILQNQINALLQRYGFCPIAVDGELGPATCGAIKALREKGEIIVAPATCQSTKAPSREPCGVARKAPAPTTTEPPPPRRAGVGSGGGMLLLGGFVLAMGAGAFILTKRRRRR